MKLFIFVTALILGPPCLASADACTAKIERAAAAAARNDFPGVRLIHGPAQHHGGAATPGEDDYTVIFYQPGTNQFVAWYNVYIETRNCRVTAVVKGL